MKVSKTRFPCLYRNTSGAFVAIVKVRREGRSKQVWKSLETHDRDEALTRLATLRIELTRDCPLGTASAKTTLRQVFDWWIDKRQLAPSTREIYTINAKSLLRAVGDRQVKVITPRDIEAWARTRNALAPESFNREVRIEQASVADATSGTPKLAETVKPRDTENHNRLCESRTYYY